MKLPKLTEKETRKRAELTRAPRPRLAATIVLYSGTKKDPRILMGRRSPRNDFMPSVYVFPGGRVDRADSYAPFTGDLSPRTENILEAAFTPRKARALALSAIRETWEETDLMLGRSGRWTKNINHPSWDAFRSAGILPDLTGIELFGRAVTPPHRHKRYDTWFFAQRIDDSPNPVTDSQELSNVGWYSFEEIESLELQRATVMMLSVFKEYLRRPVPEPRIFHSYMRHRRYVQDKFPR